jgi:hypothetical protein
MFQLVIKYNNIFHSKALQNFTKIGIFGLKTIHLATLLCGKLLGFAAKKKKLVILCALAIPSFFVSWIGGRRRVARWHI